MLNNAEHAEGTRREAEKYQSAVNGQARNLPKFTSRKWKIGEVNGDDQDEGRGVGANADLDNIRNYAELNAHGYEPKVKPEIIVNDEGEVFEPLFTVSKSFTT